MGLVHAEIELSNPREPERSPVVVTAMVDTGALHLCIPEHVMLQLGLEKQSEREVTTADGRKHVVPYVGPIAIRYGKRQCFTGALVIGDEALLGAVPMEDMDLVVDPARRQVTVNPENPNIPASVAKGLGAKPGSEDIQPQSN